MSNVKRWMAELRRTLVSDSPSRRLEELGSRINSPLLLDPPSLQSVEPEAGLLSVLMMVEGAPVGKFILEDRPDGVLWISDVWVFSGLTGKGLGRRAIERLKETAKAAGYRRIAGRLEDGTPETVARRRRFFERCGFVGRSDNLITFELSENGSPPANSEPGP